jgi:hypothetical protein
MPTVLTINGFKFHFYSDEGNEPCHIHVKKGDGRGKLWLEPEMEEEYFYGFTLQQRRQIKRIVEQHHQNLIEQWYEYFQR